jgi:hypothetical protein
VVNDSTINKLGRALKKHGFKKIKKTNLYVYELKELDYEKVDKNNREESKE